MNDCIKLLSQQTIQIIVSFYEMKSEQSRENDTKYTKEMRRGFLLCGVYYNKKI